jgi:predicted transcriptional regulator
MTSQIPDDLERGLQDIAAVRNRSVEQLAVERLRASASGDHAIG